MHQSFCQPVPVKDCQIYAEPYPTKEQRRPGPKPEPSIDTVRTIGSLPPGWEIVSAISDLSKFVQSTKQRFSHGSAVVSLVGAFGAKIGGCPKTDKQLYVSHQELFTILQLLLENRDKDFEKGLGVIEKQFVPPLDHPRVLHVSTTLCAHWMTITRRPFLRICRHIDQKGTGVIYWNHANIRSLGATL